LASSGSRLTVAKFKAALEKHSESATDVGPESVPSSPDPGYREAAAVLAAFEPLNLKPVGDIAGDKPALPLVGDIIPFQSDPTFKTWTLRPEVRRSILETMDERKVITALEANPDRPQTELQSMLEAFLTRSAPAIDELTQKGLELALQVSRWVSGVIGGVPTPEEIQARLAQRRLLAPFEPLVEHFSGRVEELAKLRDFVGVYPPSSRREGLRRHVARWRGDARKPPLMLQGEGGVGKSTLLAKFVLDHAQLGTDIQIPYAYLNFDNPTLVADRPPTLLLEAARQLAIQYPDSSVRSKVAGFEQRCVAVLEATNADDERIDRSQATPEWIASQQANIAVETTRRGTLVESFVDLVRALVASQGHAEPTAEASSDDAQVDRPLLLVLDTFEEVQFRTASALRQLWALFEELQNLYPLTRVVVSGRVEVRGPYAPTMLDLKLGDLDRKASEELLGRLGVTEPQVRRRVYDQVKGNPLSLRLAAQVLAAEGPVRGQLAGLKTGRLPFSSNERLIQGQLYVRLLSHIHDPDVRKLAHPGLVVRRIDPDVIRYVLAGPCEIDIPNDQTARSLFERLRAEVALVQVQPDGSVRHRPDVRARMLDLLRSDTPGKVEALNRSAVRYYTPLTGIANRAEELYHRLQLGDDPTSVDARWLPGVEEYLKGAIPELPARSAAYLRAKLGFTLSQAEIARDGDQLSWELATAREADDLLREGLSERALALLRQRQERRPGSPLYAIEARVLNQLGQTDEAAAVIENGIADGAREGTLDSLAVLYPLAAASAEANGDLEGAARSLKRAEEIARQRDDRTALVDLAARRLRVLRSMNPPPVAKIAKAEAQLSEMFLEAESSSIVDPIVIKRLVQVLGPGNQDVVTRSLGLVRVRPTDDASYLALANALVNWMTSPTLEAHERRDTLIRFAETLGVRATADPTLDTVIKTLEAAVASDRLEDLLERLLSSGQADEPTLGAIADIIDDRPTTA